jgi:hypothetical protein
MAQGNYDHASYLTRQMTPFGKTTAGANGTSLVTSFPSAVRLRNISATITTAGTSTNPGSKLDVFVGTASVGTIATGTLTANAVATSGDLNTLVAANTNIFFKNGTDATCVAVIGAELHIDPSTGTWS